MVSARLALRARLSGDTALWRESGLSALEQHLMEFGVGEKARVLQQAVRQKTRDLMDEVLLKVGIALRSLQMPLADLERRLGAFDEELSKAEEQRMSARYLVAGEQTRVNQFIESCAERVRNEARAELETIVRERVAASSDGHLDEAEVQNALAEAIPRLLQEEFGGCATEVERRIQEVAQRHQGRVGALFVQIRQTAADLFEIPYDRQEGLELAAMDLKPHWLTRTWSNTLEPIPLSWTVRLLPRALRNRITRKRIDRQVDELVVQNAEDLRWTMLRNADRFFLRLRSAIDDELEVAIAGTQGAMQRAYAKRRERMDGVAADVAKLSSASASLRTIGESFSPS
jgi:hypothetical protein